MSGLNDDLCDRCMRSGVEVARTDEDGNTVCVDCDRDEEAQERQARKPKPKARKKQNRRTK